MANPFFRIRNGFQVAGGYATDPVTGKLGEVYFNTTTGSFKYCSSVGPTVWAPMGGASGTTQGAPFYWDTTSNSLTEEPTLKILPNKYSSQSGQPLSLEGNAAVSVKATGTGLGNVTISTADAPSGNPSDILITAGLAGTGFDGGDVIVTPGARGSATQRPGRLKVTDGTLLGMPKYSTDPDASLNAQEGDLIYNSSEKKVKVNVSNAWAALGGGGLIKVDYVDPINTTLPVGVSYVVDGDNISNGQTVLFTALTSGANSVYTVSGVGISLVWTIKPVFPTGSSPSSSDTVIVNYGTSFKGSVGLFRDSAWQFNDRYRGFNGADYFETSGPYTTTLADNAVGNVFTVPYAGSEYMLVDYALKRGLTRETGTIRIVSDGATATAAVNATYIGSSGVILDADVLSTDVRLRFTTTSTGQAATMKFKVTRFSDATGGPGGPPSYTAATVTTPASGTAGEIQFSDGSLLTSSPNFKIDTADNSFNLAGLRMSGLSASLTLAASQTNTVLFSVDTTIYSYYEVLYSADIGGARRIGRLFITEDGVNAVASGPFAETGATLLDFDAVISGPNINVRYTNPTTNVGSFKYSITKWG